jgi:hypothetical protein
MPMCKHDLGYKVKKERSLGIADIVLRNRAYNKWQIVKNNKSQMVGQLPIRKV